MRNAIIYTICLLGFFVQQSKAQRLKEVTHREINIHSNDSSIKAMIMIENKVRPNEKNNYYWYYNNEIKSNRGGYNGKLLDKKYLVTDYQNNLLEQGEFKKGMKSGEWKRWNKKGELITVNNWCKGNKNGAYRKYENGRLIEKGCYRNNRIHGVVRNYASDTLSTKTRYKMGEVVPVKEKKKKEEKKTEKVEVKESKTTDKKKWNPFKRSEEKEVKEKKTKKNKSDKKDD